MSRPSFFPPNGKKPRPPAAIPRDRGQIVIPQEARRYFGISPGDTLLILGNEKSGLVVTKPEVLHELADEILGKEEENDADGKHV